MSRQKTIYYDVILTVANEITERVRLAKIARTEKAMREYLQVVNPKS
jgi:hypothetical protein